MTEIIVFHKYPRDLREQSFCSILCESNACLYDNKVDFFAEGKF